MTGAGPAEPSPRAAAWLARGWLDLEFYAALRGEVFSSREEAAEDFVRHGLWLQLTPHPDLDVVSLPREVRRAWRQGRARDVLEMLDGGDGRLQAPGPLDRADDPGAVREELRRLAARLGGERHDPAAGADDGAPRSERTGVSLVVVATDPRPTARTVESVLQRVADLALEVEVVVVDPGTPPATALHLHALWHERPEVRLHRVPATLTPGERLARGIAIAGGELLLLASPGVVVRRGVLAPLVQALDDPTVAGAQPVVLGGDDMIVSAGTLVRSGARYPLLVGHPREDAIRLAGRRLDGLTPDLVALRAADVAAAGGPADGAGPAEVLADLGDRLLERRPGGFRVTPAAYVTTRRVEEPGPRSAVEVDPGFHEDLGFVVGPREGSDHVVTGVRRDGPGPLRWSLQLPSWPGRPGDIWGDTHFADALAGALRSLGHEVVTRRRGADGTGPVHLDDVCVAIRGLYPIPPTPGRRNLLWIISHPDDVTPEELEGYDVVCAASTTWSAAMSQRWGREVVPLLQATGFEEPDTGREEPGVVFVGNNGEGRERPLVWAAVEAGVPLTVHGRGWQDLPPGTWQGEYVDNARLPEIYHRHGVVLADHWADMAARGFVANRVFDAVASGAGVICDDVVGVHDVFDPREVAVATTPAEVAAAYERLRSGVPGARRPDLTFVDRARELVDLVTRR